MRVTLLLLLSSFSILSSCQNSQEHLISLIKNHYANFYVNGSDHKKRTLKKLENYLLTHPLNEKNEGEISSILNEFNDGHLILKNTKKKNPIKQSDLTFIPGSFHLVSCENSCLPSVAVGKYEIVEVDGLPFKVWLSANEGKVAASSPWGRTFRTSRLLISNGKNEQLKLKLKNSKGETLDTNLRYTEYEHPLNKCIEGIRFNKSNYYLKIKTLWCEKENDEITKNYRAEWDRVTSEIKKSDKIIIDLRSNNGGDDLEVVYSLNSFLKSPVLLSRFQFLTLNLPGKLNKLLHLLPFPFSLWAKMELEMTDERVMPKNVFYDNPIRVLISAGCFSSCETFASVLKVQKRAQLIGTRTHGGAGDPIMFPIAHSSYVINLPTSIAWQSNGELFEGVGVKPDLLREDKLSFPGDSLLDEAISN